MRITTVRLIFIALVPVQVNGSTTWKDAFKAFLLSEGKSKQVYFILFYIFKLLSFEKERYKTIRCQNDEIITSFKY